MRHSCRCSLHPVLALLVMSVAGSVVGIGIQLWLDPLASFVAIAHGAIMGVLVAHAWGENMLVGLGLGVALSLLFLGVAGFVSIVRTLLSPPSMASPTTWFAR